MSTLPFTGTVCNLCGYTVRAHAEDNPVRAQMLKLAQEFHLTNEHPDVWARIQEHLRRQGNAAAAHDRKVLAAALLATMPRTVSRDDRHTRFGHETKIVTIRTGTGQHADEIVATCEDQLCPLWMASLPMSEPMAHERLEDIRTAHLADAHPDRWLEEFEDGL